MAAVKSRRGGAGSKSAPPPPPKKKAPPPPMPRLARIQLAGGARTRPAKASRGAAFASAILFGGAAVAGAAWIGGSLFDVKETFYASADRVASAFGLEAKLEVRGVTGARMAEIVAEALPPGRDSIMAASPDKIKAKVESLDWVDHAEVSRLWPSTIRVTVQRRKAFALWQENGAVTVIDAAGERLHGASPEEYASLPRVVGAGAGPAAEPILLALEQAPMVRKQVAAIVRIGARRWDLSLRSGAVVALPEARPADALARLETLERRARLLDGAYKRLDLRAPGRIYALPADAPHSQA